VETGRYRALEELRWRGIDRETAGRIRRTPYPAPGRNGPGTPAERRWIAEDGSALLPEPLDPDALERLRSLAEIRLREDGFGDARVRVEVEEGTRGPLVGLRQVAVDPLVALLSGEALLEPAASGVVRLLLLPEVASPGSGSPLVSSATLVATPGPRWTVRTARASVSGDPVAEGTLERIRGIAAGLEGGPASADALREARRRLLGVLRAEGRAGSRIEEERVPVPGEAAFDIEFRLEARPRRTLRGLRVEGAAFTRPAAILRYATLREGEPLDEDRIEADLRDLAGAGFVSEAWTEIEEEGDGGAGARVVLHVRDRLGGEVSPKAGVDSLGRPVGALSFGLADFDAAGLLPPWDRLPVGNGESLGLLATFNDVESAGVVVWRRPRTFSRDADLEVSLRYLRQEDRAVDWTRGRVGVATPVRLLPGLRIAPGLFGSVDGYRDLDPRLPAEVLSYGGSDTVRGGPSLDAAWAPFHPLRGEDPLVLRAGGEAGLAADGGARGTLRTSLSAESRFDLSGLLGDRVARPGVLLRTALDRSRALDGGPLGWGDLLRAGGPATLRGFAPNGIGPLYAPDRHLGDRVRLAARLALPLRLPEAGGVGLLAEPFLDAAALGPSVSDRLATDASVGGGVSIFLTFPRLGLGLGLHAGRAIRREDGDQRDAVAFGVTLVGSPRTEEEPVR
jgi:hypothetical protein